MKQGILFIGFAFFCLAVSAQAALDSIQKLEEVTLSDTKLLQYASGFKVTKLNDSILAKNATNLTGLLAFNSNVYFKENGFGMISSPSFRGTNASQTAVIWNGININSQLTGQTDFNVINTTNFNSVAIKSGGGSVQYGSGSIGGTIHLNNKLEFSNHFKNTFRANYGSFNTKQFTVLSDFGNTKFSGNIGLSYNASNNDYKYLETDKVNENGAFNNQSLNLNLGYFISDTSILKLYHQSFISERNLSGTLVATSRSRYDDSNFRSMLEWSCIGLQATSKLKVAHLYEEFKYFENKDKDRFNYGIVNTFILKHNYNYKVSNSLQAQSILEYNTNNGSGSSFKNPERHVFSATALLKHQPTKAISYGLNIRRDFVKDFESPFVFSVDSKFNISKHYLVKLNASKNFRMPTFNDLFWESSGNLELIPETSYQLDFGQEFICKPFNLKLNAFYISTENLIQWKPNETGDWRPINIAEALNYGVEARLNITKQFNKHSIDLTTNYSYTVAENIAKKRQLIYVPFHKGNANIAYSYKQFTAFYQQLFNGEVFTLSRDALPFYNIGNLGVSYALNTKEKVNYTLGFKVNNVFNAYYENVALRPMPNRNFQIQTTIKF